MHFDDKPEASWVDIMGAPDAANVVLKYRFVRRGVR